MNADRELKILLSLVAGDLSGSQKVRAEMAAIQGEQARLVKQLQTQSDVSPAIAGRIETLKQEVGQQALVNAQMERRVIIESQIEAAEARIAGNPALAVKLEREADIRARALTIQRALNISVEESIVLAEKLVLAQEAQVAPSLLVGANLNKAKAEAMTLAREVATGTVNMRTMSAFMGSLGTTITIASLAGYELFQVIGHAADEAVRLAKEYEGQTNELARQAAEWNQLAKAAGDFGDVVKLGEKIQPGLEKLAAKLKEIREHEISGWEKFQDIVVNVIKNVATGGQLGGFGAPGFNQKNQDDSEAGQARLTANAIRLGAANEEAARKAVAAWEALELGPLNESVVKQREIVDASKAKYDQLLQQQNELLDKNLLDPANAAAAVEVQRQLNAASSDLELQTKRVDELTNAWNKEQAAADAAAKKGARDQVNASLRDQATILQGIQQQQQLIAANPFLTPDAKQQLMLASMSAELIALGAAIERTKQQLAGSVMDPVLHERLQAQLQKDQFEFNLLQIKIAAINKPLGAELAEWVNSFGTSAHQIAGIIESSINASLQATNQLLIDSAFRTGDWRQTIVGLEKQLLQFFLTWMEQQALQLIFGETAKQTSTASSIAQGAAVAAAHAPAAAATSISSYGTAAIVGEALAVAAIIAIMAALSGGFKKGGYTGHGDENEIAGPVHRGEFVFSKSATSNIGLANLEMLHRAAPHFADGGRAGNQIDYDFWRQYNIGDHYKADSRALPSDYTPGGGIEPPGLRGNYVGVLHPDRDAWMYARQPLDSDMGTAVVRSGPSIEILPGDHSRDPISLTAGAGISPIRPIGPFPWTGAEGTIPGTDNTPFLGYGGVPGAGFYVGGDPSFASSNAWLASFMGGYSGGRPNPGYISLVPPSAQMSQAEMDYWRSHPLMPGESIGTYIDPRVSVTGGGTASGSAGVDFWNAGGSAFANLPPGSIQVGVDSITHQPVYRAPGGQMYVAPSTIGGGTVSGGAGFYAGTYFNYGTGHYNHVHDSQAPGQDRSFAASGNQGAEFYTARDPMKFGMNPTQDGGRNVTTGRGHHYNSLGIDLSGWSAAHSSIFQSGMLPHRATGGRIAGAPSKTDSILAMLAPGEHVIDAFTTDALDRRFGRNWADHLLEARIPIATPRFAAGGRVGSSASSSRGGGGGAGNVAIAIFDDRNHAAKWLASQDGQKMIVDAVNNARHEIGLGAVN